MFEFFKNKALHTRFLHHKLFKITLLFITIFQGTLPVTAQPQLIHFLPGITDSNSLLSQESKEINVTTCIRLDGRCLFSITYPQAQIADRVEIIQNRLSRISNLYFSQETPELKISKKGENNPRIYVNIGDERIQLIREHPIFVSPSLKATTGKGFSHTQTVKLQKWDAPTNYHWQYRSSD